MEFAMTPPRRAPPELEYFCIPLNRLFAAYTAIKSAEDTVNTCSAIPRQSRAYIRGRCRFADSTFSVNRYLFNFFSHCQYS